MPYELHPIDPDLLPDLPEAQWPSLLEQLRFSDSNMLSVGWYFIATTGHSTPITTATRGAGIGAFIQPGSGASTSNTNTLGLTFTHFINEHIAAELFVGVPPKITLRGHGTLGLPLDRIFPGASGRLGLIDLANTDSNPIATTHAWLGTLLFKYYLGDRNDRIRPFIGAGISYGRFNGTNISSVFKNKIASYGGLFTAANDITNLQTLLQDPTALQQLWRAIGNLALPPYVNVSATVKSVWTPALTIGTSVQITPQIWVTGMITYIPVRTTLTLNVNAPNRLLLSNTVRISVNPVIGALLLAYRF
ncbi:OmpW/AlkL family protein [Burkholderia gladioli]